MPALAPCAGAGAGRCCSAGGASGRAHPASGAPSPPRPARSRPPLLPLPRARSQVLPPPRSWAQNSAAAATEANASALPSAPLVPHIPIFCIEHPTELPPEYRTAPDVVLAQEAPAAAPGARMQSSAVVAAPAVEPAPLAAPDVSHGVLLTVRLRWHEPWEEGKRVLLFGSWNDWTEGLVMDRCSKDRYALTLTLQPGAYDYKFNVDGEWRVCGEAEEGTCSRGHVNNTLLLADERGATFRWRAAWGDASSVAVVTSADGWRARTPLARDAPDGDWTATLALPQGRVEFKYLVDEEWRPAPGLPAARAAAGNAVLHAASAVPAVTLAYASGWAAPRLVLPATAGRPAAEVLMSPAGRGYWRATLPTLPPDAEAALNGAATPALAFTISDGAGAVDAPPGGGLYRMPHAGGYKLERGRLTPFPCALRPAYMVVTDLDGTLIGDGPEADAATSAFRSYWDGRGRLSGGVLAFNTGRSIGQVLSLLRDRAAIMPIPDVIISAVGTKMFVRREPQPKLRQTPVLRAACAGDDAAGAAAAAAATAAAAAPAPEVWEDAAWALDEAWARHLDEGWRLEGAQAAAGAVVEALGESCHWLDKGTEHPHRVSLAVRAESLETACTKLRSGLAAAECGAKIIVSGAGEWRYVDAVAPRAGKRAATEHIAAVRGVPLARTVAFGDSGNDTDMLSGAFPAVVVGNAQPDLAAWALAQRQDGRLVAAASHGAAGVLEGLARHGLY